MKTLLLNIILTLTIVLCACSDGNKNKIDRQIDPKAIALNDSAISLKMTFSEVDLLPALDLLDSAIKIEPDYFVAHHNKYVIQRQLGMTSEVQKTLIEMEKIQPNNAELKVSAGIFYEYINDRLTAREKFLKADEIYKSILDTLDRNNEKWKLVISNKAFNDLMLGRDKMGRQILMELIAEESDEDMKEIYQHYLNLSREELLNELNK